MSRFSRRLFVISGAALPALAVPTVAVVASTVPDPIHEAIERYQSALFAAI